MMRRIKKENKVRMIMRVAGITAGMVGTAAGMAKAVKRKKQDDAFEQYCNNLQAQMEDMAAVTSEYEEEKQ